MIQFGLDPGTLGGLQIAALAGLPLLALAALAAARLARRRLERAVADPVRRRLTASVSPRRRRIKAVLTAAALMLALAALARPQWGARSEIVSVSGTDIMVVLDCSRSMDARDVAPSRLEKAKAEIAAILDRLPGDRVGLVAFAGSAFVECPLTSDYGALKMFLEAVDSGTIVDQGTAIGDALEVATRAFGREETSFKIALLFTDGEDTVGDPLAAAERAAGAGVVVYAVGLGSPAGAPIPVAAGQGESSYKRDRQGGVVVSQLDEETLARIAARTGGSYHRASSAETEVDEIARHVDRAARREIDSRMRTSYVERYQPFLLAGVVALAAEAILGDRRAVRRAGRSPGRRRRS